MTINCITSLNVSRYHPFYLYPTTQGGGGKSCQNNYLEKMSNFDDIFVQLKIKADNQFK